MTVEENRTKLIDKLLEEQKQAALQKDEKQLIKITEEIARLTDGEKEYEDIKQE